MIKNIVRLWEINPNCRSNDIRLQRPTTNAAAEALPLQTDNGRQGQHDVVRLSAGLARLTALNPALWFESSMVPLDILGLFTLLLSLCFIQIELLVADTEPHLFLTGFDSIRD